MANISESNITNNEELRIVMVGKTGNGKSATGNTILGREYFKSKCSPCSVTAECLKGTAWVDRQKVAVIDTPGRFTDEEKQAVQEIQKMFGKDADRYSMVLFTGGDPLDNTIDDFLAKSSELKQLVAQCNGQYHVFKNKKKDVTQVNELFQKIRTIAEKNGGSHYTNDMFQKAEREIEEEQNRILKETEEQKRKELEQMERKLNEKYKKEIKKITQRIQAERKREKIEIAKGREREKAETNRERKRLREETEAERQRERDEREQEFERSKKDLKEQLKN